MKKSLTLIVGLLFAGGAFANGLAVSGAWIRLLPGDLPAAGYFTLKNDSAQATALVGAASPDFTRTMLHRSVEKNGTEKMIHVDSVPIPANGVLRFAPGGYHLMLMKRHHPLKVGDRLPITLRFQSGTTLTVDFVVRGAASTGPN